MQKLKSDAYAITLSNLYAGGLLVVSLIILQDFITLRTPDPASFISVLAFSVALPFLAGVLVVNVVESKYPYGSSHWVIGRLVHIVFALGVLIALVGVAAAFWHVSWIAGVVFLGALVVAFIVDSVYVADLDEDVGPH